MTERPPEDPGSIDAERNSKEAFALHAARPVLPSNPADAAGFRKILQKTDFRLLWAAQVCSQLADKFFMFTLVIIVYTLSHADSLQSILMIAYTLPSVFLSAPAGVYVDRHDKRTLMFQTNAIRAGLILLVPLCSVIPALEGQTWPLLIITFLFSAVGQVFAPAEAASIPSVVSKRQIMTATSLFMTTVIVTLVIGIPLAPLCIRLFGNQAPFYIAAALFGVAALCIFGIGSSLRAIPAGTGPETDVWRELREGLAILRGSRALLIGLAELTLALVVVFTVFALGPSYMDKVLHRSPSDTYLFLIPATVGLVAMASVMGQESVRRSRAEVVVFAIAVGGACLVLIGAGPRILNHVGWNGVLLPAVMGLSAVFGGALGAILIPAFALLQERTTEQSRGRIFGGIFTVINAAIAVPLLAAGVAADLFHSVGGVLAVLGLVLCAVAIVCRTRLWRALQLLDTSP